jgi:predicted O-methyltransferase YrrM
MARVRERVESLQFQYDTKQRGRLEEEFAICKTMADHFAFSNRAFGPQQIETEILGFLDLVAKERPRTVCEIGTANSGTTFLLGQALPTTELLIGIDLFIRRRRRLYHFTRRDQAIVLVDGDSGAADTLSAVRRSLGTRPLDLLFIDGDHTLHGVARDFRLYREFVRDGGLIAFHDIVEDSFTRSGIRTDHWTGDVPVFWRKLKERYVTHEFIANPNQDGLGIGVLRYDQTVNPPDVE